MKQLLVRVLVKEIGIGDGLANDIADACTPEQLEAVTDYIRTVKKGKTAHYIDNWEKYTIMMMTAFKAASITDKPKYEGYKPPNKKTPLKATQAVKQASMDEIREFLMMSKGG